MAKKVKDIGLSKFNTKPSTRKKTTIPNDSPETESAMVKAKVTRKPTKIVMANGSTIESSGDPSQAGRASTNGLFGYAPQPSKRSSSDIPRQRFENRGKNPLRFASKKKWAS